jgi:hypothetical protein
MNVSVRPRDATLFPARALGAAMDRLIVEEERQLSPVVVIMTAVLALAFLGGLAYTAIGVLA